MNETKGFLLFIITFLGLLFFLMLWPFTGYLLGAALLAFVLHPLKKYLAPFIGQKLSSGVLVVLGVTVIVLPLLVVGSMFIQEAQYVADNIDHSYTLDISEIEEEFYNRTGATLDVEYSLESIVERLSASAIGSLSQFLGLVAETLIGLLIMLFVLYYLLKDGDRLVEWSRKVMPLPEAVQNELQQSLHRTTWAVIMGHVLVAIIQGSIIGFALYLVGIPSYLFWSFVMVLLGFIPLIGTSLVWFPASIYLAALNQFGAAAFLILYGILVANLTDEFLRPYLVDRKAKLHPAAILIGVIGGVYVFGAAGLFIGPVVVGAFKTVVEVFSRSYESL